MLMLKDKRLKPGEPRKSGVLLEIVEQGLKIDFSELCTVKQQLTRGPELLYVACFLNYFNFWLQLISKRTTGPVGNIWTIFDS
jgi:hypothetical protein